MMTKINDSTIKYIFFVATTILTISILFLFFQYTKVLDRAINNAETIKKTNVHTFSQNIERILLNSFDIKKEDIFNLSQQKQKHANNMLSLFAGEQYPYIYIISKDKDGKYRYILDGSKSERGEYLQKFDPESDAWKRAWNGKTPQWKTQNTINGLWVTYLYPILINSDTAMILAFDFSVKERVMINTIFSPIKKYLLAIVILLLVFMSLVYLFGYLFYQQRKKTFIDSLTGLHNRHYLNNIIDNINLENTAIAIIDLDHFKRVNDSYGHGVGDMVLKNFALKLKSIIQPNDTLIRYGGEEFLLLLSKKRGTKNDTQSAITSIQEHISKDPINIDNTSIHITASIGFNDTPYLNRSLQDAIEIADKMLYIAKTSGRNKVQIHKDDSSSQNSIYGPREVMEALEQDRLVAYYQPIADARSEKIIKYEALVRLIDKDDNVILPWKFLPHIKSNTAYRSLSKFMLTQALQTIYRYDIAVSVNFDVGDFLDDTLYEVIYDIISTRKNLASNLCIELLEDRQIENYAELNDKIFNLQKLGATIAIDDFGSGYSTFSYLLALNPNTLKIDGFLVKKLPTNSQARAIVRSIVELCQNLGITVVAEFVSDDSIKNEAQLLGIDLLQGYAIGRPSPYIET